MSNKNDLSILFVEDDKIIRQNYVVFLEKEFLNVYEANDGESALKIYKEKKPDILIIDINLPKMNGLEFLEKVREKDISTKAIMFTSNTERDYLLRASELKLSKYLVKPVEREELKNALLHVKREIESFQITSNKVLVLKDNYVWNFETCELKHNDELIALTKIEQEILSKLFKRKDSTVSYDELLIDIWNVFDSTKLDLVKTAIKKLRKKLPEDTILNIYGQGYKIV